MAKKNKFGDYVKIGFKLGIVEILYGIIIWLFIPIATFTLWFSNNQLLGLIFIISLIIGNFALKGYFVEKYRKWIFKK